MTELENDPRRSQAIQVARRLNLRIYSGWTTAVVEQSLGEIFDAFQRVLAVPPAEPDWRLIAEKLAEAIRLTREYVGEANLPALPGWSWYEATKRYEEAVAAVPPAEPQEEERTYSEQKINVALFEALEDRAAYRVLETALGKESENLDEPMFSPPKLDSNMRQGKASKESENE